MVNWRRRFPHLNNFEIEHYRTRYDAAKTRGQKQRVLSNAEQRIMRFNSSSNTRYTTTLTQNRRMKRDQERRQKVINTVKRTANAAKRTANAAKRTAKRTANVVKGTAKRTANVAKRTAKRTANTVRRTTKVVRARMPNPKEIFELSTRLGQTIYESREGLLIFTDIIALILISKGITSRLVNKVVGKVFLPLNVSKEGILDRLERIYSQPPENLGLIVAANAWLSSERGTSIAALQFAMLLTIGVCAHLLTVADKRGIMKIPRVLDIFISFFKYVGFSGVTLSLESMFYSVIKGILVWHGKMLAAKGINSAISSQSRNWVRVPMKLGWRLMAKLLQDDVSRRAIETLLSVIMDMKFAPKSVVRQAAEVLKVVKKPAPTLSLPQPRTPIASRKNGEQVAESPNRLRTTVVNMPIQAVGNNGKSYNFTQNDWNSMNRNQMPSTSRDSVVRLTFKNQVRYARRSFLSQL